MNQNKRHIAGLFLWKGIFGTRDINKKIYDLYYSLFDANNEQHQKLAQLSRLAHEKTAAYLTANPPQQALTPAHLGRLRAAIKKQLNKEMGEIDKSIT